MQFNSFLSDIINLEGNKARISNLTRGAIPLIISHLCSIKDHVLIICSDPVMTSHLARELQFYNNNINYLPFPDWETLPYDSFSPHDEITSQRIKTLYQLNQVGNSTTCISLNTGLHRLCPTEFIKKYSLYIQLQDSLDLLLFKQQLISYGYENCSEVISHGQFSIKGSLIDIFPMGSELPYRIDLFDNEIDSIRTFATETQISLEQVTEIRLLPAHEFPLTEDAIKHFRNKWRDNFDGNPLNSQIYESISNGTVPGGIEYFIPLFFPAMHTIFDYLNDQTTIIILNTSDESISSQQEKIFKSIKNRYENYNVDKDNPLLAPEQIYLDQQEFNQKLKQYNIIEISSSMTDSQRSWHQVLPIAPVDISTIAVDRHLKNPISKLAENLDANPDYKYFICCESAGRKENIISLLKQYGIKNINKLPDTATWESFINCDSNLNIGIAKLDNGFIINDCKIVVISESELFGNKIQQRRLRKLKNINQEHVIRDLIELKVGSYVVHQQHGIGQYQGLEKISINNIVNEYLHLKYSDNSKVFVPVYSLEQISRYAGIDNENIELSKLGSKSWSSAKNKALKKIKDTASELLAIYAKREAKPGYRYNLPVDEYDNFCANFKFEETPDQELAISQVLSDMQKNNSMDRLVCGDVGFGKTEVALRAAFIASMNNKQVAILVPTTLLAQQHYENFADRFADFPINIRLLTRFKTAKENKETIEHTLDGKVDIVIGTHKLLQQSMKFHDLGLLIIDEEHRFGVTQKEKIKKLRSNVDILTLTATPIPRTLNLSLTGIRDLSIITTPPQKRLAIKTFLKERCRNLIFEAISRELKRGGQVYFLHNNIKTINSVYNEVCTLFPEQKIAVAHGQLRERELEKIMSDFYHRKYHILICTTIIETGIDIPSANTILIDRADKLGLAQLHQIRGRVGRSHHQAYAYLFTPRDAKISKDAYKRLEAISSLENLGAGFTLASHDMEIRGTGNLLGDEQSGHIETIGYSLYMDLLNKAIKALKSGQILDIEDFDNISCEVDIKDSALLPEDYINDVQQRLVLYKRIASAENEHALDSIKLELSDRFGKLPKHVTNLFLIHSIKIKAIPLKILKIDIGSKSGKIKFNKTPYINQSELINMIQKEHQNYKLSSSDTLSFSFQMKNVEEKYNIINNIINRLTVK